MAHTIRDKDKLLNRVRRVRGQIEAVERLLENESECEEILQQIAACRRLNQWADVRGPGRTHPLPFGRTSPQPQVTQEQCC